jgi:hypothetical protein
MTFEELQKANASIKTTDIKGKAYAEVNERIKAFRMLFPNGTISTDIVSLEDGVCVMKAIAMNEAGCILATGYAYEKEGSTFINKTSYIENAETSAVGRCLGMLGIGIDTSIASYEEVTNAMEQQEQMTEQPQAKPKKAKKQDKEQQDDPEISERRQAYNDLIKFCVDNKMDITSIANECGLTKDSTKADFEKALEYAQTLSMMAGGNG